MQREGLQLAAIFLFVAVSLCGQESVCDLFEDLKAADGRQLIVSGELIFDSFEGLKVEALSDPSEVPVIPICELFQDLAAWKGKRIAVRGESSSTSEGSWIVGRCQGSFYTNGYRWPVALDYAAPAFYSSQTAALAAR